MKKSIEKIIRYFPDFIIQIGIYILSTNLLTYESEPLINFLNITYTQVDYQRVWAIMLITIGINIVIRRNINKKR